jgi:hypothetical protein
MKLIVQQLHFNKTFIKFMEKIAKFNFYLFSYTQNIKISKK